MLEQGDIAHTLGVPVGLHSALLMILVQDETTLTTPVNFFRKSGSTVGVHQDRHRAPPDVEKQREEMRSLSWCSLYSDGRW